MNKKIIYTVFITILLYLLFYPVPFDPESWKPKNNKGFTANYEANNLLSALTLLFPQECEGCEDIAIDSARIIYGASASGDIFALQPGTSSVKSVINTGGRPLGLELQGQNNLIIADAVKGLLNLDLISKELKILSNSQGGKPFLLTDDLDIDSTGQIYFTDASSKFGIHDYQLDLIEHRPNGRLLKYNPKNKTTHLLKDSLYFANGIAIDHTGRFVLVNETGLYRVSRYWLTGQKAGEIDIFIDNLPGFPDGISRGDNGIFWLTLISPRKKYLDAIMSKPFIRKILVRLPDFMQPKSGNYNCILGLNDRAEIVFNLQSDHPKLSQIASVQQFGDSLYFGSLTQKGVGLYSLKQN